MVGNEITENVVFKKEHSLRGSVKRNNHKLLKSVDSILKRGPMLNFFHKKASSFPSESKWDIFQGKYNGLPMIVRRNKSAKVLIGSEVYKHRVGFAIPLLQANELGFPTKEEAVILDQIEDALFSHLEKDQNSIQVLSITTNGMREFVFYTRKPELVPLVIEEVQKKFRHEIQYYIKTDKSWSLYRHFS